MGFSIRCDLCTLLSAMVVSINWLNLAADLNVAPILISRTLKASLIINVCRSQ